ncbi:YbaB/EbfC family nucleoid-associated protein [Nocardia sp. NPDC059240]|uniref:YbaB/EbfC family nucleoid-associated protein n=1 Tax=Nocardia sp. NPDC059240 TaxID=3346786 RepID=UPI003693B503
MSRDEGESTAASILEGFTAQMREIAEASQRRVQLTASGTAARGRVTVTVNADGVVISTRFAADIGELTYQEIAAAVTAAAQQATEEVQRQSRELLQPLRDRRAKMPRLSELIEGMPELATRAPIPPASLAPPQARERLAQYTEPAPRFSNAVDYDEWSSDQANRGATDSSW